MDQQIEKLSKLEIFLSWSGPKSERLAQIFKNYIEDFFANATVYMSSEDIHGGEKWRDNIEKNLNDRNFSFIFLTPDNLKSKWIYFEAGALSKSMDSVKIQPFVYDLDPGDIGEPLSAFQARKLNKDNIRKTFVDLNDLLGDDSKFKNENLIRNFERMWNNSMESEIAAVDDIEDSVHSDINDADLLNEESKISLILETVNELKNKQDRNKQISKGERYVIDPFEVRSKIADYSLSDDSTDSAIKLLDSYKYKIINEEQRLGIITEFNDLGIPITPTDFMDVL